MRWIPIIGVWAVAAAWGQAPHIGSCNVFPADSIWNARVDSLPLDRNSTAYIQTAGADRTLFADFGSGLFQGAPIGIPYMEVPGNQSRVPVTFQYSGESDAGPYPIPPDAPIEGGPGSIGDRHILALDRENCVLYELFAAYPQKDGSWRAGSGAIFPLNSHRLRPAGWTSADAAGLPILPGLARYEEVVSGEIRHALRLTVPRTRRAYMWPATHFASTLTEMQYPPMGQRFRLRSDFDISSFSAETQAILRALKRYGLILADNGSSWYISGAPDERWNNDRLRELRRVRGADLEAVDSGLLMREPTSGQVRGETRAAVVNAASYAAGFVAARELVAIFGEGIGAPDSRVYFDGMEALVLGAAAGQVNAIVPDSIAGRQSTEVRVESGGRTTYQANVAIAQAQPGLFVQDRSGQGQAAALNQDYSVNSTSNPIARGEIVMLFATGGGTDDLPVAVRVGGREAEVLYAGAAPGFASLLQVNARIPVEAAVGPRTPVAITVGGWSTQADVTLALR